MAGVPKFASSLCNSPYLVTQDFMDFAFNYLSHRDNDPAQLAVDAERIKKKAEEEGMSLQGDVAKIDIKGPLTYEPTFFQMLCGGISYTGLLSMVDEAIALGAKKIVLDINGPGGEAYGCFETAVEMRKRADKAGVELIGYVDGMSASATYGLSAVCHTLIMNPDAEVGSVGVVMRLANDNKKQKDEGIETTYVFSGESKIPFNEEGEFRADFINDLQVKVDRLYGKFVSHVASHRGMSEQAVRDTQAKMFVSEEALALGLVDDVMTKEEFYSFIIENKKDGESNMLDFSRKEKLQNNKQEVEMSVEMQEQLATMTAQMEEQQALLAEMVAERDAAKAQAEAMAEQAKQEKLANVRREYSAVVEGWSFIAAEQKDELVECLMGVGEKGSVFMTTMEAAQQAINASVDVAEGVEGEAKADVDNYSSSVSATSEILKNRKK